MAWERTDACGSRTKTARSSSRREVSTQRTCAQRATRGFRVPFTNALAPMHFASCTKRLNCTGVQYDVTLAISMNDYDRALLGVRLGLFFAVPAFLALAAVGGYWISRRALAPVDEITRSARNIEAHDLSKRLAVPRSGDELGRLAGTLNEMLGRLETAFKRITQFTADASHELRTPVSVIRTGAELALSKPRAEDEYRETLFDSQRDGKGIGIDSAIAGSSAR